MTATTTENAFTNEGESEDLPQSPHAMAEAVLAAAVADRERQDKLKNNKSGSTIMDTDIQYSQQGLTSQREDHDYGDDSENQNDTALLLLNGANQYSVEESAAEKHLNNIWNHSEKEENNAVTTENLSSSSICSASSQNQKWTRHDAAEALEQTEALLKNEIESLIRVGINAFHTCDSMSRELMQVKELAESRGRDLKRLQTLEAQSRSTVSNLLRAVEASKSDARDSSRTAQIEARLRGEVSNLRSARENALASASESKRKASFLEEEVRLVKAKLSRVSQEKIKIERDSRAALSLARSLDSHASSDTDYYKRKVAELNDRLQSQQAQNAEQKRLIDEMRKHYERSVSQNRLAQIRAAGGNSGNNTRRGSTNDRRDNKRFK